MIKLFATTLLAFVLNIAVNAADQTEIPKFKAGKIDISELQMNVCPIDSGAHAFYLFDTGRSRIYSVNGTNFKMEYVVHFRMKFIDKTEIGRASFEIPLYIASSGEEESLYDLKATTYNLENGNIVATKLTNENIFKESKSKKIKLVKFALPNVKEGSVIEVEYKISSEFFWFLRPWGFQGYVPALWSIYKVEYPEYFYFSKEMQGYLSLYKYEENDFASSNFTYRSFLMAAKDVPAFKVEPFIDAAENYFSKVRFELNSIEYPLNPVQRVSSSWYDIASLLMLREDFGRQIGNSGTCTGIVQSLNLDGKSDMEKATAIFDHIKVKTKWDGGYSLLSSAGNKKVYEEQTGNSGEINLLLVGTLRAAGLNASPIVCRTRSAGRLPISFPSLDALNDVIAIVTIDEQDYFLDAISEYTPFGFLPERCINGQGVKIKENNSPSMVDLKPNTTHKENSFSALKITDQGTLDGEVSINHQGYAAYDRRNKINSLKSTEKIVQDLEKKHTGTEIADYLFVNLDSIQNPLKESFKFSLADYATVTPDRIYFNPCAMFKYKENPFKLETREYPVDFAYSNEFHRVVSIALPEGWTVESLPENLNIQMAEQWGSYMYTITSMGQNIFLNQKLKIDKPFFLANEYDFLKQFFNMMVSKQNEQVVLKKL